MSRTRSAFAFVTAATLAVALPVAHAATKAPVHRYTLGAASESINPTAAMIAKGDFYLGGYGLGSGKVANRVKVLDGRAATGIMRDPAFKNGEGDGVHVRAVVIGDGKNALAMAQIETQGMLVAYKQGPFGLIDIRKDAAAQIATLKGPKIDAAAIVVDSNHTHSGPDTPGVWGGVPTTYLKLIHDQSVKAIVAAYRRQQSVDLVYGTAHAGVQGEPKRYPARDPLLTNQFSYDDANQEVDEELRVLQARKPGTKQVVATYLNYSSHPTVLDSDNTLVSGDYTAPLNAMLTSLGGVGMEQVATLGRTQPARSDCHDTRLKGAAKNSCKIHDYAQRVFDRTKVAIAAARPLPSTPLVAMKSFYLQDVATDAAILGLNYAGVLAGAPIYRATNPPWMTGNIAGTMSFSGRIGDILINGGPGEIYPQIVQKIRQTVPARGYITIGTAGDFLGYIIAPLEAYPEPLRRGFFDGSPPPKGNPDCTGGASPVAIPSPIGCPSPVDNDNYFFNVSHTLGERLTCSLLRGAGEVMKNNKDLYWSTYARCPIFANDHVIPAGFDTTFPAQPDLSAIPGFDH